MVYSDLFIIGGGVNGCGIARDAIGRGLSVRLAEQNDLGSATSSASTKLFHGGLRYLEHYAFRLVRESLIEREILLNAMPHISWPMRFLLPLHKDMRPAWLIRLGLLIYDHLGGRKILPPTHSTTLRNSPLGKPLKSHFSRAFEYSDCWVQDSRLVSLNAFDASLLGADILVQNQVTHAKRTPQGWEMVVHDKLSNKTTTYKAKVLINAAGPWVGEVINNVLGSRSHETVRLVRGSHIIVNKLYDHDRCYLFQNNDGRIAFVIPYENDFTLIGTTDIDHKTSPDEAKCSDEEVRYLCDLVNDYFALPISEKDVVWSYSGIRPLYDDKAQNASAATRDYVLRITEEAGCPLVNVFGGKITTYRRLAESVIDKIKPYFDNNPKLENAWTATAKLPGGDFAITEKDTQVANLVKDYPFIDQKESQRLINLYGTKARDFLGSSSSRNELGEQFGKNLSAAEVTYLIQHEFARTAEDILWRRTKLGLYFSKQQTETLAQWINNHLTDILKNT